MLNFVSFQFLLENFKVILLEWWDLGRNEDMVLQGIVEEKHFTVNMRKRSSRGIWKGPD